MRRGQFRFKKFLGVLALFTASFPFSGCEKQPRGLASQDALNNAIANGLPAVVSTAVGSNNTDAFQVITKADPSTGSFDSTSVPVAGGVSVRARRLFFLDGTLIPTGNFPTWFADARVFLTSTRTSGANPVSPSGSNTPCAYFDSFVDNNPDSSGFYTIDGYNATVSGSDIDQCAGTAAAELNQTGIYVQVDRRFLSPTDKLMFIVKAKIIDDPNTAPTASTCVTSGFFDPSACSNQVYTLTMRTGPGAAAKPFYILFPSAKSLDLLSESVLIPMQINTNVTTISIDRVKGGAVFYGISIIRMP